MLGEYCPWGYLGYTPLPILLKSPLDSDTLCVFYSNTSSVLCSIWFQNVCIMYVLVLFVFNPNLKEPSTLLFGHTYFFQQLLWSLGAFIVFLINVFFAASVCGLIKKEMCPWSTCIHVLVFFRNNMLMLLYHILSKDVHNF